VYLLASNEMLQIETHKFAISVGVQIIYNDLHPGKRTKEFSDRLRQWLGSEYELDRSLWNLAALQKPAWAQVAAETTAHSALFLPAMNGNDSISASADFAPPSASAPTNILKVLCNN